jgi:uncharacterized protein (TIGR02646 family)
MLHVDPGLPPPSLASTKARREREALVAFYADPDNAGLPYPKGFSAYQGDGVRETLTAAFHGKCAYCETNYAAAQPADIEHYRPKGAVTIAGPAPEPPGYWWLASEWSNLLPSCIDCNRPRRQDFPAGIPATAGKANRFPVASEKSRARSPGQEAKERRLLLHPYLDRPEEHLRFVVGTDSVRDGEVEPVRSARGRPSRMGRASIEVYALQRIGLIEKRRAVLRALLAHLAAAAGLKAAAMRHPDDRDLVDAFRAAVADIARYTAPEQEYAAMCRQVVADFGADLFR